MQLDLLFAQAEGRHRDTLQDLVSAIAADPGRLVAVAVEAGVMAGLLHGQPDLLAIFVACEIATPHPDPKGVLFPAAEFALRHEGCWDGAAPPGDQSPLWGLEKLRYTLDAFPSCPAHVRYLARRAIDQRRRIDLAGEHVKYAERLLTDPNTPIGDTLPMRGLDASRRIIERKAVAA